MTLSVCISVRSNTNTGSLNVCAKWVTVRSYERKKQTQKFSDDTGNQSPAWGENAMAPVCSGSTLTSGFLYDTSSWSPGYQVKSAEVKAPSVSDLANIIPLGVFEQQAFQRLEEDMLVESWLTVHAGLCFAAVVKTDVIPTHLLASPELCWKVKSGIMGWKSLACFQWFIWISWWWE